MFKDAYKRLEEYAFTKHPKKVLAATITASSFLYGGFMWAGVHCTFDAYYGIQYRINKTQVNELTLGLREKKEETQVQIGKLYVQREDSETIEKQFSKQQADIDSLEGRLAEERAELDELYREIHEPAINMIMAGLMYAVSFMLPAAIGISYSERKKRYFSEEHQPNE